MQSKKVRTPLVTFDDLSLEETAKKIIGLSKRDDQFSYVVTPNIDHLERLLKVSADDDYYKAYTSSTLTLCDSRILAKLLSLAKKNIENIVPGSDLTEYLFAHVLSENDKVLIFGCAEAEVALLRHQHPELNLYHVNPSMGFIDKKQEVENLIEEVKAIDADYIFLAVGSPRQEIFARKLYEAGLKRGVALCIGASINFIVGLEVRAPRLLQRLHLEWFFRMAQDPVRLVKRYSSNALHLPKILMRLR